MLSGFRVGSSNLVVSHLQYVDDTIILADASIKNIWSIKDILRGFELASRIHVNITKITLIGVNYHPTFLCLVCDFLHCQWKSLSFKYFSLSKGRTPIYLLRGNSWLVSSQVGSTRGGICMIPIKGDWSFSIMFLMSFLYSLCLF